MNQTDRCTIFAKWPHGTECQFPYFSGEAEAIEERIEYVRTYLNGFTPVAWAPQSAPFDLLSPGAGMRESIAAGRLIEKVDGKYVARGMEEDKPALTLGAILRQALERRPTIKPAPAPDLEPQRPRLTWADTKPADRWEGYVVYSDAVSSGFVESPKHTHSHPLQKMAEGKEGFGSAALLKG